MNMKMKISPPPVTLEGKSLTKRDLEPHFRFNNLEELLLVLRKYSWNGYFNCKIFISSEYVKWEAARKKVLNGMGSFEPVDPYGLMKYRSLHGLRLSTSKIENEESLTDDEINEFLQKVPIEMVERYMRFELADIDQVLLRAHYAEDNEATSGKSEDDFGNVEYKGLVVSYGVVYYLNNKIAMPFQERQVVRILVEKGGGLCFPDDFTSKHASVFNRNHYKNIDDTLRKLMSSVHSRLRKVVGKDCITNIPSEGWSLSL